MKARSLAVNVSGTTNRSGRMPPPPRTTRPRSVWNTSDESTLLESRPSSAASACASWSSSLLLLRWMVRPLGVYQRAVVSLSATSGVSGYSDCTSPLPNVGVPTTTARSWSCSAPRSEEHTSELQSRLHLVCRLLLEKKKKKKEQQTI